MTKIYAQGKHLPFTVRWS